MALNLSYATREAFANFGSTKLLTWLATGTITIALFLFGVFLLGTINLDKAITQVQEKVRGLRRPASRAATWPPLGRDRRPASRC